MNTAFHADRGHSVCRGCGENELFQGIDLGNLPIANELFVSKDFNKEVFPLCLMVCLKCGLGQVADVVTPNRIFEDYRYLSSISSSFLLHAKEYVDNLINSQTLNDGDLVIEIASNDGYLLRNFQDTGIRTIGIEPAGNVAEIAKSHGINTYNEFFTEELAHRILEMHGKPRLIIANNVMAHVPDIVDFVAGLSVLCGENTLISVENPSLLNILSGLQFDTIYHEHYSYLTAFSVDKLCRPHNLQLVHVEKLDTHGGSNRYWIRRAGFQNPNIAVSKLIEHELLTGVLSPEAWSKTSNSVHVLIEDFRSWLIERHSKSGRVFGYGAAAKASTLINATNPQSSKIVAIADASVEKQGRFMPTFGIPIISPDELASMSPTDVVIFPWNIAAEIGKTLAQLLPIDVKIWRVIPSLAEITPDELS